MRMIPVPELAEQFYPECERLVIAPPDGDLTNEDCRAADMLVGPIEFMGGQAPVMRGFFQLEPEDIDRLRQNGGIIQIHLITTSLPPFGIAPL